MNCRRCNPDGHLKRPLRVVCPDCSGLGLTEWIPLATAPWNEILPNLFLGGHDYNASASGGRSPVSEIPSGFDFVVSLARRPGFAPVDGEHIEFLIEDDSLALTDPDVVDGLNELARLVAFRYITGSERILIRCLAGINRSALLMSLTLMNLGFTASDAIQVLRSRRSPWVLCNESFVDYLMSVGGLD